ncbi:hypothetical protein ACQEVF_57275 [Nonomuraea polychroma]|uniref:hypothetical protein n=1 Tax=Nonomuraea polychroma TaxID=46176 RepID=UPI003D905772
MLSPYDQRRNGTKTAQSTGDHVTASTSTRRPANADAAVEDATEYVIDTDRDGDDDAGERPSVQVKLAGVTYTAYCPKDVMWLKLAATPQTRTVQALGEQVFTFLEACFDEGTRAELTARFMDPTDPLKIKQCLRALRDLQEHFQPAMEAEFEALGIDLKAEVSTRRVRADKNGMKGKRQRKA